MSKKLYVCSTYYHTLITCVKAIEGKEQFEIAVTDYISGGEQLAERLRQSGLFKAVHYWVKPREYSPKNKLKRYLFIHKKNPKLVSEQISVDFGGYDEIYLFHDDIWVSRYLKDTHTPYNIIEDALDSFKYIDSSVFSYMTGHSFTAKLKLLAGYGYRYLSYCPLIRSIEVNDADGIQITGNNIIQKLRKEMFDKLTSENKALLSRIFLPDEISHECLRGTLILTQPLAVDNIVSEERQLKIYRDIAERYSADGQVVIKPHPRDNCSYDSFGCTMLPKNVPVEIIDICLEPHFKQAVTISSTSSASLKCADKVIVLGDDILKKDNRK